MTHDSWRQAVDAIGRLTGPTTSAQQALAAFAGVTLPEDFPAVVAGARLQTALSDPLFVTAARSSTAAQRDLLEMLSREDDLPYPSTLEHCEAEGWILCFWLRRRQRALQALELHAGDVVTLSESAGDLCYQVASIGDNGRVYFRGGMGRSAWPDQLMMVSRSSESDETARDARSRAANQAAMRAKTDHWSLAKQAELSDFEVKQALTREDIDLLRATVESARDEKPIQVLVEARPQLLTALLGGSPTFCMARARLGSQYVTDFLVSDIDSRGVRWVLVELETPRSAVTLQTTNDLDQYARKGVSQVKDWREWFQNNFDKARRFKRNDGLGLVDIRPNCDGLVLVGRRALLLEDSAAIRDRIREESRIDIRTYDWWLSRLEGSLKYVGPRALSPYVLHHREEDEE
jgi:hypothetical protein